MLFFVLFACNLLLACMPMLACLLRLVTRRVMALRAMARMAMRSVVRFICLNAIVSFLFQFFSYTLFSAPSAFFARTFPREL